MRRWLVPIAAASAVVLLLGGLWSFAGPGSNGDDGSFAGGDTGDTSTANPGSPGDPGGGEPGSSGSAEPGFPGTTHPAPPSDGRPADDPTAGPTDPMAVRVDSYFLHDKPRHLSLNYTIGVPECYGRIDTPEVEETARSVTVTLTRVPPKQEGSIACIDIALLKTVGIRLEEPLGDRAVLDGSVQDAMVQRGSPPGAPSPR